MEQDKCIECGKEVPPYGKSVPYEEMLCKRCLLHFIESARRKEVTADVFKRDRDIRIYARDRKTQEIEEITDLYWFEERGVHWFDGEGDFARYDIEVHVKGKKVWPPKKEVRFK